MEYTFNCNNGDQLKFNVENNKVSTLNIVTTRNTLEFQINKVLGKSNAIVFDISNTSGKPLCLKIGKAGSIQMSNDVIAYVNEHKCDYAKIYYYQQHVTFDNEITFEDKYKFKQFDLLIMEKTNGGTLDSKLQKACNDCSLPLKTIKYLTIKLMKICTDLINNGYYYTDLKPANIGIVIKDNNIDFKLIDVDSICTKFDRLRTSYTNGRFKKFMNMVAVQYMNAFFTIISVMFNDKYKDICNEVLNYNRFISFMEYVSTNNDDKSIDEYSMQCSNYKYIILTFIINTLNDYSNKYKINTDVSYVINKFNDIVKFILDSIHLNHNEFNYFFIELCLTMFLIVFEDRINDNNYNAILYIIYNKYIQYVNTNTELSILDLRTIKNKIMDNMSPGAAFIKLMDNYNQSKCSNQQCSNIVDNMTEIFNI